MTTRKITLSLPEDLVTAAEAAVAEGRARSVSAYIAQAAGAGQTRMSLDEVLTRWESDAEPTTAQQRRQAEEWVAAFTERTDRRYAQRVAGEVA